MNLARLLFTYILNICLLVGMATNALAAPGKVTPSKSGSNDQPTKIIRQNGFEFTLEKTPSWVKPVNRSIESTVAVKNDGRAITNLLISRQIQVAQDGNTERYLQIRRMAKDKTGLEEISQLGFVFNAEYEKLALHEINIYRAGKKIERLSNTKFDLLRREQRLEQKMLDGIVTANTVLADIRVNDVVEYAFTIRGQNPIFNRKIGELITLNSTEPVSFLHVRFAAPDERTLQHKILGVVPFKVTPSIQGGQQVLELEAENIAPVMYEQNAPRWARFHTFLQISEYKSWQEVEAWAQELFTFRDENIEELNTLVNTIKTSTTQPEEMVIQALNFVQNDIRYFGIEIGVNSHRPKPPKQTLSERYGDCKDKTVLLLTLLKKLGIVGMPALVSAFRGRAIEDWLPTPLAFDHVIVHALIQNQPYWLDGTRIQRVKTLANLGIDQYDRALLVGSNQDSLTAQTLPANYSDGVALTEQWQIIDLRSPARVTMKTRYLRNNAEYMRSALAEYGISRFATDSLNELSRAYPRIKALEEPSVKDDSSLNLLEITEKFEVSDLLQYKRGVISVPSYPISLALQFRNPAEIKRNSPLRLNHPFLYNFTSTYQLPQDTSARTPSTQNITDAHFNFNKRVEIGRNEVTLSYKYQSQRDAVQARDVPAYVEKLVKVREILGANIPLMLYDENHLQAALNPIYKRLLGRRNELDNLGKILIRNEADGWISTQALSNKALSDKQQAQAHYERGIAYSLLGRKDTALLDMDEAIRLNPEFIEAFAERANILASIGNHAAAINSWEKLQQTQIDQFDPISYAKSLYYSGRYQEAAETLEKNMYHASAADANYYLIWQWLARERVGFAKPISAVSESAQNWPLPILNFLKGELALKELLGLAESDSKDARLRKCEAFYFIGQKYLLESNISAAKQYFEAAVRIGAVPYWEHFLAQQELAQLK